jgi:hypothetical protein
MTYKNPATIDLMTPYEDRFGLNTRVTSSADGTVRGSVSVSLMPNMRSGLLSLSARVSGSNGIDTRLIDPIRQGIHTNIKTFGENLTHRISDHGFSVFQREYISEQRIFGQPKLFKDEKIPFDDSTGRWDPVNYLTGSEDSMYPVVLFDPAWKDPDQMDGVIEPLSIRTIGTQFRAAEVPFVANSIKGDLIDGNSNRLKGTDQILQFIDKFSPTEIDHFEDAQNIFTHDPEDISPGADIIISGASIEPRAVGLALPGFTSANNRRTALFDDSFLSRQYHIIANMTSSLLSISETDGTVTNFARNAASDTGMTNYLKKSATAGFVYNKADEGTDSIAFGGLKK